MTTCAYCGSRMEPSAIQCGGCGARSDAPAPSRRSLRERAHAAPFWIWPLFALGALVLAPFVAMLLMLLFFSALALLTQTPFLVAGAALGLVVWARTRQSRSRRA